MKLLHTQNFSKGVLGRIKILLTKIEVQNNIAVILSDIETEIATFEAKLEKY